MSDVEIPYLPTRADYTETMQTDTLRKIYAELSEKADADDYDMRRMSRIAQVLRNRGINPMPSKKTRVPPKLNAKERMKNTDKKERAHNRTPYLSTEKPTGITKDELERAKQALAKRKTQTVTN